MSDGIYRAVEEYRHPLGEALERYYLGEPTTATPASHAEPDPITWSLPVEAGHWYRLTWTPHNPDATEEAGQ